MSSTIFFSFQIDRVKKKKTLLEKIRLLSSNRRNCDSDVEGDSESEKDLRPRGWPNFSRIFLISALTGDGVEDIVTYLKDEAYSGDWVIPPDEVTNTPPQKLVVDLAKAHFLDLIPYSIPRSANYFVDHFEIGRLGEFRLIFCKNKIVLRLVKMLIFRC